MPLHGVRVIDLSRLLPGPLATLILSDLGAEVIRVENPAGDDYTRHLEPLYPDGMGAVFHTLNRGKKSVALDLKTVSGLDCFLQMLESADVLVESFRPGVLKKLNLAPKTLQKRFPRLIICSISGYGQSGITAHFWQKNTAAWQRIFSKLNACVEAIVKNNHMQPTRLPLSKALSHPSAKPAPQLGEDNADFLL